MFSRMYTVYFCITCMLYYIILITLFILSYICVISVGKVLHFGSTKENIFKWNMKIKDQPTI